MSKLLSTVWCSLMLAMLSLAQDVAVPPSYIAYKSSILDRPVPDTCTPYPSDTTVPQGVDPTQYTQCNHPTTITDTNTEEPFYVLAEGPGQLLLVFPDTVNISSISIYYQFNDSFSLAKLRVYSVPEDFEAWDDVSTVSGEPSEPIDQIVYSTGQEEGVRAVSRANLQWYTSRVLIRKLEDTKTYLFAVSEVMFEVYLPPSVTTVEPPITIPETTATTMTMTTPVPTNETVPTTVSDPPNSTSTTTLLPTGSAVGVKASSLCIALLTMIGLHYTLH